MKTFRMVVCCLIAAVFLAGLLPRTVAANDESVLTSLGHKDTDTVSLSASTRSITLTVPFSYSGASVDLSNGLIIDYDATKYKSVVASASTATVGGPSVSLNVTYNNIADADGDPKSLTVYSVDVVRAARIAPVFSGIIAADVQSPGSLSFSNINFSSKYIQNDGEALGYISLSGSNPTFGAIKENGGNYVFGTAVSISSLTFDAVSSGTVSYDVKAYEASDTNGLHPIGNVVLTITAYGVPQINTPIADAVGKGTVLTFTPSYFTNHCNLNGAALQSVEITPTNTAYGAWYLGSSVFTAAKTISASDLGSLSFSANATGAATFNWRVSTKAGFSSIGTGTITVSSTALTLTAYTSGTSILKGDTWTVSPAHFVYTPSATLSYIKITTVPSANDGTLYLTTALAKNDTYGYPAIAANTPLTSGAVIPAASIGNLRLATKSTSVNSAVTFNWSATTDLKVSSATWAAAVAYTVNFANGSVLYYTTDMNIPLALSSADLSARFLSVTGQSLSYVTFTIPDKNSGVLYLNYDFAAKKGTAVASTTKYYTGKTPNLSGITFVPAADFIGTATITYSAYSAAGLYIIGTISVTVQNSPGGIVSLQTDKNAPLQFDAAIFQSSFLAATGKALSYVTFTLPSETYGKLYYNYALNGHYDAAVSSGNYYVSQSSYLSLVSFVPKTNYTGPVTIYFTGYTSAGQGYAGKIILRVVDSPAGIVTYTVNKNGYVALSGKDFSNEFVTVTGSLLSYVTFSPPTATSGSLYTQFSADTQTGTKVTGGTKYYDGAAPGISEITFVPVKDYIGVVTVAYTVFTSGGASYAGKLKFIVTEGTLNSSADVSVSCLTGMNTPVKFSSDVFGAAFLRKTGATLSYVKFTLPPTSSGTLYLGYTSSSVYTSLLTAQTSYYRAVSPLISDISFVPASNYSGIVTIPFIAYSTAGNAYGGMVVVSVGMTSSFTDIGSSYAWAGDAITYLYTNGIVKGSGDGKYHPADSVTRADFIIMVTRAFGLTGGYDNFSDVPSGAYYASAVSAAKFYGVIKGSGGKFYPTISLTRQDAMVILLQALSVRNINLSPGTSADLSGFPDASSVSDYAVTPMATLVKAGIITGSGGKLNPKASITRAEMAVILYMVLTL